MKVAQWSEAGRLRAAPVASWGPRVPDAVLVFGPRALLEDGALARDVHERWPDAALLGCTTAGEIGDRGVSDDAVVITALAFEGATARVAEAPLGDDHGDAGRALGEALSAPDLRAVILVSEGLGTQAQRLIDGLATALPEHVVVAGGLAGDGDAFGRTGVVTARGYLDRHAAALGVYGDDVIARCASASGWHGFGLDRVVTRSEGAVVHEIDGVRALDVYRRYLGDEDATLPSTALVYPIAVIDDGREIIRSVSAIDQVSGAITLFGDVPEGSRIRLMHASNAELVAGAAEAATLAALPAPPELALLFSCVGRKAVLRTSTQLEIDAVRRVVGDGPVLAGFHTYGEFGGVDGAAACQHHNQTMTVLTLAERP